MARKNQVRKVSSAAVQGDDSYVEFAPVMYGESKEIARRLNDIPPNNRLAQMELNAEVVRKYVVGWNWVDDDGNPLPLPKDDPTVLDRLTAEEMRFLGNNLNASG